MKTVNKRFILNLIAQAVVFCINLIINVFLTPYIIQNLGMEAYGFIGLVNNFVSYLSVVTVALNSLAGRFITLAYYKKEEDRVQQYYTSVFLANVFLGGLIFGLSIVLCVYIHHLINVPVNLVFDLRITIILAFLNAAISLVSVVFSVSTFIKNKLYYTSLAQMLGHMLRLTIILSAFAFFTAHMWYYSIGAIGYGILVLALNMLCAHKLLPELKIRISYFNLKRILEIVKSGIWTSLESLNKLLQTGLDLLITNIFISAAAMGLFSVAKQIPLVLTQIPQLIASIFNPELAKLYAEKKKDELVKNLLFTIKFLSFIMIVPLIGFVVFGQEFYSLWLPSKSEEEVKTIQILSILTILPLLANAYVEGLYYANTLTNKIKGSVLITFGFSVASITTEFILLVCTQFEPLIVIAGTSSVFMLVRNIVVTPSYCSHVLNVPKTVFYKPLAKSIVVSICILGVFLCIHHFFIIRSWKSFFVVCGFSALVGYAFAWSILLDKEKRKKALKILRRR